MRGLSAATRQETDLTRMMTILAAFGLLGTLAACQPPEAGATTQPTGLEGRLDQDIDGDGTITEGDMEVSG